MESEAKEKWKPIKGYEGLYEISDHGRVISSFREHSKGGVLRQSHDKDGYCTVTLCKDGKVKTARVHQLVGFAFVDGRTDEKCIINHKNEKKDDNNASNLEWCTPKYNTNYYKMPFRRAESKRKPVKAKKGNVVKEFDSINECAKTLKVCRGNISNVLCGRRKTAGGYCFEWG